MLRPYYDRYERELKESVIPFWSCHSIDDECGGFFTCLDREGKVYDDRKYVWLQGRAVWTYSRLYNTVEKRPDWLEHAKQGMEFLERHAFDGAGRCYFSLTRDGRPASFQRKPYAAVFMALAMLEYARASGEEIWCDQAIDLFWQIRSWIEFPGTLGRPRLDGARPVSNLADIMVEAMLAEEIYDSIGEDRYLAVMKECLDNVGKHYDPRRGIFLETVGVDGSHWLNSPDGRMFCPGSAIETAWFLLRLLRYHPDSKQQALLLDVMEKSLEIGWDQEFGGIYYFMDIEGKPTLPLESGMKLWWPHTEAIYGTILAYTRTGDRKWLEWLSKVDSYAFEHFSDPTLGEWFGYCDRRGYLSNTCKGNNYKGMYHVPRFLLFSLQTIDAAAGSGEATAE